MPLADFVIDPADPFAAVTHAAPYDYYRRLADGPPLSFNAALECWHIPLAACVRLDSLYRILWRARRAARFLPNWCV